ncbi:SRPBCC family protein [Amycolatopsis sp. NPDC051758]|uniref:SRPBCC family protein n=1 Tax=Amycolatopsis sp. NPDC051758 TaxID=3363935 RepID=UPI0037AB90BA
MVEVTRTFTVAAAPHEVVEYLKDFGNANEWDPGTLSCDRLGDGPIEVGARWHNVSKIAGVETELTYELTRLEPGRVVFSGSNKTATTTDDISVTATGGGGSTLTYHATIEFHGAAKLGAPIAKVVFEKVGADTEDSLTRVFGAPAPS